MFYSVWAVLMTALTYVLGAVSLKVLRRKYGRVAYWGVSSGLSAVMFAAHFPAMALAFFSLVVLVGVFAELEELGLSFPLCLFFTLAINALFASGAFVLWVVSTGPKWSQQVLAGMENLLKPLAQMNPQLQVHYFDLMLQLPSILLILWIGALYLAVLLEPRLSGDENTTAEEVMGMRRQLREFRLSDVVVWVFIASLLGAFGGWGHTAVEAVSANALNVCLMLFFLQGIAVVARFFEVWRIGTIWQVMFMVIIVIHLFLFVAALGLMDYWFDFRTRLQKRAGEFNRET